MTSHEVLHLCKQLLHRCSNVMLIIKDKFVILIFRDVFEKFF